MSSTNRAVWLDSAKGFATILVVLGHIMSGYLDANLYSQHADAMSITHHVIYSFHMALFFIISGFTFSLAYLKRSDLARSRRHFKAQLVNLVWVYCLFSILQWALQTIFSGSVNHQASLSDLLRIPIFPLQSFWYLWDLLIFCIVFYCLTLSGKGHPLAPLAVTIFLGLLSDRIYPFYQPFSHLFFYSSSFSIGIVLSTNSNILRKKAFLPLGILAFIAALLFASLTYWHRPVFYRLPIALLLSLGILSLIYQIPRLHSSNILSLIGAYSLEIYLTHTWITAANRTILKKIGLNAFVPNVLVNLIMAVVIPILCSMLLKKIPVLYQLAFKPSKFFHVFRDPE